MTSPRRGTRGRGGATLCAGLILACLLLLTAQLRVVGQTQETLEEGKPPTRESLLRALKAEGKKQNTPNRKSFIPGFIRLIREYGIKFRYTPADEKELHKAGSFLTVADLDELVTALKRADYRPATTLSGNIEQVSVTDDPGGGILVFVRLSVKNDGPPSIAQDYKLRVIQSAMPPIEVKGRTPLGADAPFTVPQEGTVGSVVVRPEENIALMTGQPVVKGKTLTGWLRFKLPALINESRRQLTARDFRHCLWYAVSFSDRAGEPYETIHYEMK